MLVRLVNVKNDLSSEKHDAVSLGGKRASEPLKQAFNDEDGDLEGGWSHAKNTPQNVRPRGTLPSS